MVKKSPQNKDKPQQRAQASGGIVELFTKRIKEVLGTVLIAGLAGAFWFGWGVADARIKKYIVEVIAEALTKNNDSLSSPLKANLSLWRAEEVGALNLGVFTLTPVNRAYTLFVYLPEGHTGKIYYRINGDIIPKRRFVVLVLPNGKLRRIENSEESIDLGKFLSSTRAAPDEVDDFVDRPAFVKGMRAITFQLEGPDTDNGKADSPIEVRYMTFVTPAIILGKSK